MPTPTTYTYNITSDIPSGKVNTAELSNEIAQSSIVIALDSINTVGNTLYIVFKDVLSTGDKTTLDNDTTGPCGGKLGAHTGITTDLDFIYTRIVEDKYIQKLGDRFMAEGLEITTTAQGWQYTNYQWPIDISALSY